MIVELRQSVNLVLLDRLELNDPPMPGQWFKHNQSSYLVMQRRHRYKLHSGCYELSSIVLLVNPGQGEAVDQRGTTCGPRGSRQGGGVGVCSVRD